MADAAREDRAVAVLATSILLLALMGAASAVGLSTRDSGLSAPRRPADDRSTTSSTRAADPFIEGSMEPPAVVADATSPLRVALDSVWRQTPAGCLSVAAGGQALYEANAGEAMAPASTIKVLTAAAALEVLGEDTVLTTTARSVAPDSAGRVAGDLWIVGGGDPLLGTTAWARTTERAGDFTSLEMLADRVVAAGVKRVDGRVVGDESRYDSERYVESWPDRFIEDGEAGPLSALTVNGGFREWGHPGVAFEDPPVEAASLFIELLRARGVLVAGGPAGGPVSPDTTELASVVSATVGDLTRRMLRESENGIAELLVKEIGLKSERPGTTASGVRGVVASLDRRGLPVSRSTIADGSGLSEANRVSCDLLTSVVAGGDERLLAGLAVAARDGTLERRFVGTPVAGRLRAKTGSLDGVAALTGTVRSEAGNSLAFTYIVNGLPHNESGRSLQDALATALVTAG